MQKPFSRAGIGTPKMRAFLGTPRGAVVIYCLPSENGYKNANKINIKKFCKNFYLNHYSGQPRTSVPTVIEIF